MTLASLGDLAQSFTLRRQTVALRSDLQSLATELTTGKVSDAGRHLSGDFSPLAAIDASLSRLGAYRSATSEAALFTSSMQSALGTIDTMASDISITLLNVSNAGYPELVTGAGIDARHKFEAMVSALNNRVGDRTLFGGVGTGGPALASAETILTDVETAITGLTTAADIEAAISAWFDDSLGFRTTGYLGGGPLAPHPVAAGEVAHISVTADDPAIRDTLKAMAMGALLDRGVLPGDPAERAALARRAGERLLENQTARTEVAARLGSVEEQIEIASVRNSAERSVLEMARAGILAADPFETATALQAAQIQLETLYTVTARISRLSLADYLR